jgi:hypothetical protein
VRIRHLARYEQVNLAAMVLVVRVAFVHLGFCQPREAVDHAVHRLAILQQADHIVYGNTNSVDARVAVPHVR